MPKLYSYCNIIDCGAAPNPFGEICTLVICKPTIRRSAKVGDWVVATGSVQHGFENKLIFAMEITQKMSMEAYDTFCKEKLPAKIPKWFGKSYKERVGDCIYDFSTSPPTLRKSVHNEDNRERDLSGEYALLSNHFYYFGENPIKLPDHLLSIVKQGQGHKSDANAPYFEPFVDWICKNYASAKNKVSAEPNLRHWFSVANDSKQPQCAKLQKEYDEADESLCD